MVWFPHTVQQGLLTAMQVRPLQVKMKRMHLFCSSLTQGASVVVHRAEVVMFHPLLLLQKLPRVVVVVVVVVAVLEVVVVVVALLLLPDCLVTTLSLLCRMPVFVPPLAGATVMMLTM